MAFGQHQRVVRVVVTRRIEVDYQLKQIDSALGVMYQWPECHSQVYIQLDYIYGF